MHLIPPQRPDGHIEESINWDDDSQAIQFTLDQRRGDDQIRFKYGIALIPLTAINELNHMTNFLNALSYERDIVSDQDNPYHGNLLLNSDIIQSKIVKKMICSFLATYASNGIHPRKI